uniref:Odorant binding protein c n=3 Tax=Drosophila melanogaster TaxID=7227 RepID=Q7KE33_DROME|nr:Odorant-binding protein 51a [Drosophila melanogaster]AAM68544.1 Odorant-binding protein 51a [Drosophila melanogaster]AAM69283.1 odorant binding protein c [Drosophila melanogaster]|eukprot:NP_725436.1 Odorant-binding protein 51a [Drosophila melanogaster]
MKVFIGLVLLLAVTTLSSALFESEANECAKKLGITPDYFENFPHSSRVKCFYHCQMEKLEIIANGVVTPFDLKVLNISPESYDKYGVKVKPCLKLSHRDKCELGYLVFQCLKREFNL